LDAEILSPVFFFLRRCDIIVDLTGGEKCSHIGKYGYIVFEDMSRCWKSESFSSTRKDAQPNDEALLVCELPLICSDQIEAQLACTARTAKVDRLVSVVRATRESSCDRSEGRE